MQIPRPRVDTLIHLVQSLGRSVGARDLAFYLAAGVALIHTWSWEASSQEHCQQLENKNRIFFLFCMPPHNSIITQNKHRNACWWTHSSNLFFKLSLLELCKINTMVIRCFVSGMVEWNFTVSNWESTSWFQINYEGKRREPWKWVNVDAED